MMNKDNTQKNSGFSLIEVMIGLTLGMLLLGGLSSLLVNTVNLRDEQEKASRQNENGRFAMQLIGEDLRHSGYYGEYLVDSELTLPSSLPNPCATALSDVQAAVPLIPIQGYDAPASSPISCLSNTNFIPGTDILVVRRAHTTTTALGSLDGNEIYMQSRFDGYVLDKGSNASAFNLKKKDGVTAADIRKFDVHIYFLSPCSQTDCSSSPDTIPTLKRLELVAGSSGTSMTVVPLVEGIENFQIDYGVDGSASCTTSASDTDRIACGTPGDYVTEPSSVTDWSNVVGVRTYILARNIDLTSGYQDSKTYSLGLAGTTVATGDAFKRHLYTSMIRLNNLAGRRERP